MKCKCSVRIRIMREMLEGMWGFSGLMMHIWWWNARPDGYVMLYLESVLLIWQCNANCFYNLYYCVYKCFMLCLYPNFTQSYFFFNSIIYLFFIYLFLYNFSNVHSNQKWLGICAHQSIFFRTEVYMKRSHVCLRNACKTYC